MVSSDGRLPQWPVEIAIEPKSKADQEKLGVALAKLTAEDQKRACDRLFLATRVAFRCPTSPRHARLG